MQLEQRKNGGSAFGVLDETDCRILRELEREPKVRTAELARLVALSPPAVAERLRRMEENGVLSYRVQVNPRALGYGISAIIRVSPQSRKLHVIPQIAKEIPEITECYRITGDDCYFMRVYLRSMDDLEGILDRFTPHGRTTTSMVHSAPIPPRPLPVAAGGVATALVSSR